MDQGLLLMLLAVFLPVTAGIATMLVPKGWVTPRVLLSLLGLGGSFAALMAHGVREGASVLAFAPSLHMNLGFRADQLGLFFAMLVSGIGTLIVVYARGYFGHAPKSIAKFYPLLGLFATAMLGVVLSDNLLGLFMFWELTSVSSFLLIGWYTQDRESAKLAMQAFATTGLGGLVLLAGLLTFGVATGNWNFSEIASMDATGVAGSMVSIAFVLMFVGGAAKSAQWPLHFWLPGAMAAPTPVSAYLHSATMVKAGVYLFARLFQTFEANGTLDLPSLWVPMLVSFGATTMLLGGYLALRSGELKKIFAYTTVSQLGLLVCMYGMGGLEYVAHHGDGHGHGAGHAAGEANLIWPIMQILNHAMYKAPLFIIAGAIMHLTGKKLLSECKGLFKSHWHLATIMILAAYAMAGLPLTLSFTAKESFLYQIYHATEGHPWFWAVGVMTVLTAMCNVAIFVRITRTLLGTPAEEGHGAHDDHHEHEHGLWSWGAWWPAAFIVAWQFAGAVPGVYEAVFAGVETNKGYWAEGLPSLLYVLTHPTPPLLMSGIAIALGLGLGFSGMLRRPVVDLHNRLFPVSVAVCERVGHGLFSRLQGGDIRVYIATVLLAFVGGLVGVTITDPSSILALPNWAPLASGAVGFNLAAVLLTVLICGTAIALPIVRRRIVRVLVLGTCGFSVTGVYLLYRAPDLALTQIMFEIISVVLFLLALRLLPESPMPRRPRQFVLPRVALATVVGCSVAWMVLMAGAVADESAIEAYAQATQEVEGTHTVLPAADTGGGGHGDGDYHGAIVPFGADETRLGGWFLKNSYAGVTPDANGRGGGGNNVVNVVLVDFRGYDTIGEITVLSIALIAVLSLLASVPRPVAGINGGTTYAGGPQAHLSSAMLRSAMRLILPLSLLFAAYVFFKGHQEPGGGFIAGLIASVGLAAYRMSDGAEGLKRLIPFKPALTAALGLGIAIATAVAPMVINLFSSNGGAFLMSDNAYWPLPGGGEYHWTSVALFDLGVFIVVVAVSVGMINRFEEELETS